MKAVFTIWRDGEGEFYLKAGNTPLRYGDVCFKLLECANWAQANAELHKFMDQRQRDMAPSA